MKRLSNGYVTDAGWKKAAQMLLDGHSYQEIGDELGVTRQCISRHFTIGKRRNIGIAHPIVYAGIRRYLNESRLSARQISIRIFTEGDEQYRYVKFLHIITWRRIAISIQDIFSICRYMNMPFEEAFAPVKEDESE